MLFYYARYALVVVTTRVFVTDVVHVFVIAVAVTV
jgi:hypothetical protein